jgi:hypothetical protein
MPAGDALGGDGHAIVGRHHLVDEFRRALHGAKEGTADAQQPGCHRALQRLRRAHQRETGCNGRRRDAVLEQRHQHRVDDLHLGGRGHVAHDLEEHHLREGDLADQFVDQALVAHVDGVVGIGADGGGGLLWLGHGGSFLLGCKVVA